MSKSYKNNVYTKDHDGLKSIKNKKDRKLSKTKLHMIDFDDLDLRNDSDPLICYI